MIYKEYKDEKIAKYLQRARAWNWVPMIFSILFLPLYIMAIVVDITIFSIAYVFGLTLTTPLVISDPLKWKKNTKDSAMGIVGFILACILCCLNFVFASAPFEIGIGVLVFIFLIISHLLLIFSSNNTAETRDGNNESLLSICFWGELFWLDMIFFLFFIIASIISFKTNFINGIVDLLSGFLWFGTLSIEGIYILLARAHIRMENKENPPDYYIQEMEQKRYDEEQQRYEAAQKEIRRLEEALNRRKERQNKLLSSAGKRFFIKYYDQLKNWSSADVFDIISENYSEESKNKRIASAKKIFEEELNVSALESIAENQDDTDEKTQARAKELLQKENQQNC